MADQSDPARSSRTRSRLPANDLASPRDKKPSGGTSNFFDVQTFIWELLLESQTMDERRTLVLFGLTIGGVVVLMFVLNAFALASLQEGSHRIVSQAAQPAATPSHLAYQAKSKGSSP
jgi:hypothetical protein